MLFLCLNSTESKAIFKHIYKYLHIVELGGIHQTEINHSFEEEEEKIPEIVKRIERSHIYEFYEYYFINRNEAQRCAWCAMCVYAERYGYGRVISSFIRVIQIYFDDTNKLKLNKTRKF